MSGDFGNYFADRLIDIFCKVLRFLRNNAAGAALPHHPVIRRIHEVDHDNWAKAGVLASDR